MSIVVVLPVPLTPTTRITAGRSLGPSRASLGGSPRRAAASSTSASLRSPISPRASRRRTSSAVEGTPTSAAINASSSRSQAASSAGSNFPAAICSVSARRLLPSESRRREKKPAWSASVSSAPSASPSSSAQDLATAANASRALAGCGERCFPRHAPRDDLRDAVGAHRDAVEAVCRLHRPLLVRDHDELGPIGVAPQQLDEAADVRVVERGFDLVQQIERAWTREEEGEEKRDRTKRLLAAREKRELGHALAGRAQLDLDPWLRTVVGTVLVRLAQPQTALAAGEERLGDVGEVPLHGGERLLEAALDRLGQLLPQLLQR